MRTQTFRLLLFACLGFLLVADSTAQVICIDPGHPSEIGEGTTGKKLTELHANWVEAVLLKKRLERRGITVVMTKNSEKQYVANKARAETANKAHATLMVRLHCDSASGSGFTCYYPGQQGKINGFRGPTPEGRRGLLVDNGLKTDLATSVGAKHGALIGSIYSKVPVVLIEMVVLTNRKDEAFLSSVRGQDAMAAALEAGVVAALHAK